MTLEARRRENLGRRREKRNREREYESGGRGKRLVRLVEPGIG